MDGTVSLADIAAVTNRNDGYGNGFGNGMWGMEWIFALMILPMMWGNGGFFGNNRGGNPVTEADLCQSQSFAELKGSVGRGFDQQTQFAFQNQRDMCQSTATLSAQIERDTAAISAQQAQCCCDTKQLLMENRYLAERNAADTNATVVSQIQSIKDMLCQQEAARKDARIQQLELNQALYGVVRYPNQTTYATNCNPFFGGYGNWNNNCGGCCGNGNI